MNIQKEVNVMSDKKIAEVNYTNRAAEFLKHLAEKIDDGSCEVVDAKSSAISETPEYVTHTIVVKLKG